MRPGRSSRQTDHPIGCRLVAGVLEGLAALHPHVLDDRPERVARHSLAARLFHWIMAAAMFTLLITAFLPKVGVKFPWVTYH